MNFEKSFPLVFWFNLGNRQDRRLRMERQFLDLGVEAERVAGIDARLVFDGRRDRAAGGASREPSDVRGYESPGRYALAVAQRLAIREARRRGAPAVLLLEDDAVFHPNFMALIKLIPLPEDWGIFYFGCVHFDEPEWAGTRVVKVKRAADMHAVAIHSKYYDEVMGALDRHGKDNEGLPKASDAFLASLSGRIPSYACYPNLVWQAETHSDLMGKRYSNYSPDGAQLVKRAAVQRLLPVAVGGGLDGREAKIPRLALLFLTRGRLNHPRIWREFIDEAPENLRVFCHPKDPMDVDDGVLGDSVIDDLQPTKWGNVSLVRASRSLLAAALKDETITHFVLLSESCVPIVRASQVLNRLRLDPRPQFVYSVLDMSPKRFSPRTYAVNGVPHGCWRFHPQWWLFDRVAATISMAADYTDLFETMMVPDECYFATVLAMQGYPLDGEVNRRFVTWTKWEEEAGSPTEWKEVPQDIIESMLSSGAFFARKFPVGSNIGRLRMHLDFRNRDFVAD